AAVVLLLIAMVVGGGIGVSGAVILTFSIWLSILGLVAGRATRGSCCCRESSSAGPSSPTRGPGCSVSGELIFGLLLALGLFTRRRLGNDVVERQHHSGKVVCLAR